MCMQYAWRTFAVCVGDVVQGNGLVPCGVVGQHLEAREARQHLHHLTLRRVAPCQQRVLGVLQPMLLRQCKADALGGAIQQHGVCKHGQANA